MSYLISLVVQKEPNGNYKWAFIGAFGGMHWSMAEKEEVKKLNKMVYDHFEKDTTEQTTEELLKTVPVDEVIVLDGEYGWNRMKTTPVHNIGGKIIISEYLKIKSPPCKCIAGDCKQ